MELKTQICLLSKLFHSKSKLKKKEVTTHLGGGGVSRMPYSGMIIKRFYLFTTSFSNVKELTKLSKYYGVEEKKMLYY